MAVVAKKKKISKKKKKNISAAKKKEGKNEDMQNDYLSNNPFTRKEKVRPFDQIVENEESIDEEVKKDAFEELLNRRIKEINKSAEKKNEEDTDEEQGHGEDIENFGKKWYEEKLVKDVPRKLTTI
ncbi:conserved Plasmodium protein, unknown function [Plasmodium ovale curtisi]|uniref:Uncharacterized protein n=1 Tax=Plasmodium ovale curtisi TaxID=864141 RepID=A0A1A8W409_PLAOA|nr:conserved Plasmodium protein, unknown function [Plasmodium ovale curtisi]